MSFLKMGKMEDKSKRLFSDGIRNRDCWMNLATPEILENI